MSKSMNTSDVSWCRVSVHPFTLMPKSQIEIAEISNRNDLKSQIASEIATNRL